jgi:hypothetical protein
MIRFTKHIQEAISIRDITIDWIEAAVSASDWIEPDPRYPGRTRSYKAIAEYGARVCGLCIGQKAMISSSLRCISIAEPGDDQNFL